MDIMIKSKIEAYLKNAVKENIDIEVFAPENEKFGHYSTNVALKLAKLLKQNPMEVAEAIIKKLKTENLKLFEKIEVVAPGFINFFLKSEFLTESLKEILDEKEKFGQGKDKKQTIVIEYSSPNIAKPLGIHHLSATIIGQALVDILRFSGYKVISLSFPGDWGTQFGLLIAGYKHWGDDEKIKKNPIPELLDLYVKFSEAAKNNPELLDEGRNEFKKLENKDKENLKLWKWFSEVSMEDFEKVYKMLGVKIENTIPESYYEPELKKLIDDALKNSFAQKGEDGSVIIPVPESQTPEIIQKSDGSTIYTTRELAAIRHRIKKWKADKVLYVAANQQTFHLAQVFRCAELLGFAKPGQLGHIKFGMILGPGGKKFATREGRLIPLEDVLKEAIERSFQIVEKLNPDLPPEEKKEIAKIVGIGAVKFYDLSQNRLSDIVFDWDKMLDLKSNSAPYIQYTYARLKSILRKAKISHVGKFDPLLLKTPNELALIPHLLRFPEAVEGAAKNYEPNRISDYLLKLSEKANLFYETTPVLKSENDLQKARLALIEATTLIIKNGLKLLGIDVLEKM